MGGTCIPRQHKFMKLCEILSYLKSISLQDEYWVKFKASEKSNDDYIIWHVSNKGRIAKNLTVSYGKLHKDGYMYTGNMKAVHRIVAEAFIPKSQEDIFLNRDYIDHIDGDKCNNCAENLRWCTIKENNNFPLARLHSSLSRMGSKNIMYKKQANNKNKVIFNNGVICKYFYLDNVPEGFIKGRIKRN